jgi:hypothetical protein
MADWNHNRGNAGWPKGHDGLGRELDGALAKYTDVEPRAGLENRVLANLRAERERLPNHGWWRWSVAGALATVVIVSLVLAWKSGKPSQPVVANHASPTAQPTKNPATQVASNSSANEIHPRSSTATTRGDARHPRSTALAAADPKLDHFPSPRPLSKEEQLLVRYVQDFPQEAVMIAKAQAESEKEMEELSGLEPSGTKQDQPSGQPER